MIENVLIDTFTFSPELPMEYDKIIWMFSSDHYQDCCETHELDFDSTKQDFETAKEFLSKVDKIDISRVDGAWINIRMYDWDKEYCIHVPGRGYNNWYYGSNIDLIVKLPNGDTKTYDVSSCQDYS